VEAQTGGHVDVEIGMMHPVQPPQRRNRVKEHMLKVDREIEKDDRGHHANPGREWHHVEKPEPLRVGKEGKTDGRGWKENANQECVNRHDAEVIGPSPAAPDDLESSGSNDLPYRHQGKYAAKRSQSDKLLVCEQSVAHNL
jgi:hypothetical protein